MKRILKEVNGKIVTRDVNTNGFGILMKLLLGNGQGIGDVESAVYLDTNNTMTKKQKKNENKTIEKEQLDKIIEMLERILEELDTIRYYAEEVYQGRKYES